MRVGSQDSSVGIATRYGLDSPGIESRWKRKFPQQSSPALGPVHPPTRRVTSLFVAGIALPSSAEVKEETRAAISWNVL